MKILETSLRIDTWNEEPYREVDGEKWARAEVTLDGTGGLSTGAFESLLYYRPDGTSTYVTLMRLDGVLDGRSGGFVLHGHGTYDGTTARVALTVVPGSGTAGLAGLSGTAESVSTHADYPQMPLTLRYDLA
jgi:Protein of unknown function (DUF3224)